MTTLRAASRITGWGMSVPDKVVTNDHFAAYLETTDEWIRERSGIIERRWVDDDTSLSDLALPACRDAIKKAGLSPDDIDGVICATVSPDYIFPGSGCILQAKLGISKGPAFDVNAVCTGFVYALSLADSMIVARQCRNILVVGADIFSRFLNMEDRSTCVLFGDGAGAVVLSATAAADAESAYVEGDGSTLSGIYSSELCAQGDQESLLCVPQGSAALLTPERIAAGAHLLTMEGREVFKLAVRGLAEVSERVVAKAGMSTDDIDYVVAHQANKRILMALAKHMKLPEEKVPMNMDTYGNTSAATVPILFAELANSGKIKKGDLLLMSAFGGGLTWGAVLVRF